MAATTEEIKESIFGLIDNLINFPQLSENKKQKLVRLRAFIQINLKEI